MDFWTGKRVIVTGGGGFLGSFVVERLRERGASEVILPRSSEFDLREVEAIRRLLHDASSSTAGGGRTAADIVIHLAANVGGIEANKKHPAELFYDNLMMGVQLLHECWRGGVGKFVVVGSVCSYPKVIPIPFVEEDLWNGYPEEINAPYGLAKKMLLVQSQAYRQQYGFNSIYLIPVNLYGPGANFDSETAHVIPALVRKFLQAMDGPKEQGGGSPTVTVWGTGIATREFLYVDDAAEGIMLATERYDGADPVNLGAGTEISIKELVNHIACLTKFKGEIIWDTSRPEGQPRRSLDTSRAERLFGFRARTPFKEGIVRTINWYQDELLGNACRRV